MTLTRGLLKAWKILVFSRIPSVRNVKINLMVILGCCLRTGFLLYLIVIPFFGVQLLLMNMNVIGSSFFPFFVIIIQIVPLIVTITSLQVKKDKYEVLVNNVTKIKLNFHCDKIPLTKWIYDLCFVIWILVVSLYFVIANVINNLIQFNVVGTLYGLWWLASTFILHFYLISFSVVSRNISEAIYRLNFTVQNALLREMNESKLLQLNHRELICRTLKCIEEAYDNLCDCCSSLNDVFGLTVLIIISTLFLINLAVVYMISRYLILFDSFSAYVNLLQLWISFYALMMMAASCESVHGAARDLCRSLALFNSELNRGDNSLDLRKLARDVLHAVRERRPRLSACGLFDLRMTLVTGYLSLMATYSIVLLQFTHFL